MDDHLGDLEFCHGSSCVPGAPGFAMAEPALEENQEEESDEGAKGPLARLSSAFFFPSSGA